jgi:uncharacterized protein with PIN domain
LTNKFDFEAVQVYQAFMTNLEAKCLASGNNGNNTAGEPLSTFRRVWPEAKANLEKELSALTTGQRRRKRSKTRSAAQRYRKLMGHRAQLNNATTMES